MDIYEKAGTVKKSPSVAAEVLDGNDGSALNLYRMHLQSGTDFGEFAAAIMVDAGKNKRFSPAETVQKIKDAAQRVVTERLTKFYDIDVESARARGGLRLKEFAEDTIQGPIRFFGLNAPKIYQAVSHHRTDGQSPRDLNFTMLKMFLEDDQARFDAMRTDEYAKPHQLAKSYSKVILDMTALSRNAHTEPEKEFLLKVTTEADPLHQDMYDYFMQELNRRRIALGNIRTDDSAKALGQLLTYTEQAFGNGDERFTAAREAFAKNDKVALKLLQGIQISLQSESKAERNEASDMYKSLYPVTASAATEQAIAKFAEARITLIKDHLKQRGK